MDQVCSNIPGVCAYENQVPPSCQTCNVCNAPNGYACISQTTYVVCNNGNPGTLEIPCNPGLTCHPAGTPQAPCSPFNWTRIQRCPLGVYFFLYFNFDL